MSWKERIYSLLSVVLDILVCTLIVALAAVLLPLFALFVPLCRLKIRHEPLKPYFASLSFKYLLFSIVLSLVSFVVIYFAILNIQFLTGAFLALYGFLLVFIVYLLFLFHLNADLLHSRQISFSKLFFVACTQFPLFLVCMFFISLVCYLFWNPLFLLILLLYPGSFLYVLERVSRKKTLALLKSDSDL